MGICNECRGAQDKWLDTGPQMLRGIRIASGAAYDDTAGGAPANRNNRVDDWRRLVNFQTALIARTCATQHPAGQMPLWQEPPEQRAADGRAAS
jgi:hypothetical protein